MSHSVVAVVLRAADIGKHPNLEALLEEALAPFDENTSVEPYRHYIEKLPAEWRTTVQNEAKFKALQEGGMERKEAWQRIWGEKNLDPYVAFEYRPCIEAGGDPENLRAVADAYNSKYGADDEDERVRVDALGLYQMSTYNPDSRWDWWTLGGRWAGDLTLRPDAKPLLGAYGGASWAGSSSSDDGLHVSAARKKDIDWQTMEAEEVERLCSAYDDRVGKPKDAFDYNVNPGETKEQFVARELVPWRPFAWLIDGQWIERGKMCWWGVVSDEKDKDDWTTQSAKILDSLNDDDVIAIVDVHI